MAQARTMEPGGPLELAALPDLLAFGRARRREAEAFARWRKQCSTRAMPPLDALPQAGDCIAPRSGLGLPIAPASTRAEAGAPGPLVAAVLGHWAGIAAAAAPQRMEFRTAGGQCWRGLLLPYGCPATGVDALWAIVAETGLPDAAELADVAAMLAGLPGRGAMPAGAEAGLRLEPVAAAPLLRIADRARRPRPATWTRAAA